MGSQRVWHDWVTELNWTNCTLPFYRRQPWFGGSWNQTLWIPKQLYINSKPPNFSPFPLQWNSLKTLYVSVVFTFAPCTFSQTHSAQASLTISTQTALIRVTTVCKCWCQWTIQRAHLIDIPMYLTPWSPLSLKLTSTACFEGTTLLVFSALSFLHLLFGAVPSNSGVS